MVQRLQQIQPHYPAQTLQNNKKKVDASFGSILTNLQKPQISHHASQRLTERNIQINDQQWLKIGEKMHEAKEKGVTDSLVVLSNAALLVSTKNNTIVTAMDHAEASTRIFTNINGTILIQD